MIYKDPTDAIYTLNKGIVRLRQPSRVITVSEHSTYTVRQEDTFRSIAYDIYKNADLWWAIATYNNITNPLLSIAGKKIKIPKLAELVKVI
jgi:nucleoid-associated protein YgaU